MASGYKHYHSAGNAGTSPSVSSGQAAIDRFATMMIDRMEYMKAENWKKGWIGGASGFAGMPQNVSGRNYNGSNSFFLQLYTAQQGYQLPVFLTFNQAHNLKAHVLKGEKAFPVVYWDMMVKDKDGHRVSADEYRAMSKEQRKDMEGKPDVLVYQEDETYKVTVFRRVGLTRRMKPTNYLLQEEHGNLFINTGFRIDVAYNEATDVLTFSPNGDYVRIKN